LLLLTHQRRLARPNLEVAGSNSSAATIHSPMG
jgi:hypothetical protein